MKTKKDATEFLVKMANIADSVKANKKISNAIMELRQIKKQAKMLAIAEAELREKIEAYMGNNQRLVDLDGTLAITWIKGEPTQKFDLEGFKDVHPRLFAQFQVEVDGRRIFLVK